MCPGLGKNVRTYAATALLGGIRKEASLLMPGMPYDVSALAASPWPDLPSLGNPGQAIKSLAYVRHHEKAPNVCVGGTFDSRQPIQSGWPFNSEYHVEMFFEAFTRYSPPTFAMSGQLAVKLWRLDPLYLISLWNLVYHSQEAAYGA